MRLELLVLSVAFLSAAPAISQTAPQQQPTAARAGPNPDQVICEKQEMIGSRLSSQKICHTRAQWDEMRRDDRSATEHIQSQRAMDANGH